MRATNYRPHVENSLRRATCGQKATIAHIASGVTLPVGAAGYFNAASKPARVLLYAVSSASMGSTTCS